MFAYMADAALFRNCADGKTYPVAMEAAFPNLTRTYRKTVKDAAGSFAFVQVEGSIRERPAMEGGKMKATLVVDKVIGCSRAASCETDMQRFSGLYTYYMDTATFQDCNGQRYPVSFDGVDDSMMSDYTKTGAEPQEPVFVQVEGFLSEDDAVEGDGKETTLHILRHFGFQKGAACP